MKSVNEFIKAKVKGEKISTVTCYDFWSAKIINESDVDAILVVDSSAMVMHGFETTINAKVVMMCYHVDVVKRAATSKFIIADIPFLEHKKGIENLFQSVDKLLKAGANAIKLEGVDGNLDIIKELTQSGIPVMGHIGLTPQSINKIGGYIIQGKDDNFSEKIFNEALKLQSAGCFYIVLELIPSHLAKEISINLSIPTIGIGAGLETYGQVLVLHDLLGFNKDFNPKFV
ncbi:3-methyl-2-oxobutanoate hydroxymethyltransferase [Melioribacteraceae bacterium 09-Me]|uniref:3-methyl-2-oxobutanoate hydroxymethyltransferase n=1 Tax=Stygiobacter electus TaxID=3032292 RepID=A0AAE3TCR0_9BACT|nr:3-methyl-2-oxobutanoate hydroxymethyltransferase [Stygiobacter electus]MDF1612195.1 3-methyl-2-oxobutanoate hydroxymethyltransferase [Stygiobacter electus]